MEKGIYIYIYMLHQVAGEGVNIRRKLNHFHFPNREFHSVNNEKLLAPSLVGRYAEPALKTYMYICVINECSLFR